MRRAGPRSAARARTTTGSAAYARYREGEVHRLRGEFAAAEAAYREAHRGGYEPQPGLALLRLAQGNGEAAAAAIRRIVGRDLRSVAARGRAAGGGRDHARGRRRRGGARRLRGARSGSPSSGPAR